MVDLVVYARDTSSQSEEGRVTVRVFWRTGLRCKGALDVVMPQSVPNPAVVAEIVAIRYLLGVACVQGPNRLGAGLHVVCSRGAVKKAARGDSAKTDLYEYARALGTRYADAEITISKDKSWVVDDCPVETVDAEQYGKCGEIIETEALGAVEISIHALDRYASRETGQSKSLGWRSLAKRLNSGLQRIELPSDVLRHKLRKYGGMGGEPEIWKHPDSPLHYVFVPDGNHKKLVTVFNRKNELPKYLGAI